MNRFLPFVLSVVALCAGPAPAPAIAQTTVEPLSYLTDLDAAPHLEAVEEERSRTEGQHLVPLGAIQKIRGVWAPREQDRVRGTREAFTWRVIDGFTSAEVLEELETALQADERVTNLFSCDARACGASVQWANRIFRQRLLYGREDSQRYRVLSLIEGEQEHRLLLYASARSTDRQYLHAELIELQPAVKSE